VLVPQVTRALPNDPAVKATPAPIPAAVPAATKTSIYLLPVPNKQDFWPSSTASRSQLDDSPSPVSEGSQGDVGIWAEKRKDLVNMALQYYPIHIEQVN